MSFAMPVRKKPVWPKSFHSLPKSVTLAIWFKISGPSHWAERPDPAHLEGEPAGPEADEADGINHEVHGHGVRQFLARQRPVSRKANPACMNMTRNPATRAHTMFKPIFTFFRSWSTVSGVTLPSTLVSFPEMSAPV